MRLLDTESLTLRSFDGSEKPDYAILSHTWEATEILYADVLDSTWRQPPRKPGADKVENACRQAKADGYQYIWIDTCCIDKNSSSELSEAINSMFAWYVESKTCYAFLADVDETTPLPHTTSTKEFTESRWFRRGWTLQELIAPAEIEFFDRTWRRIGDRASRLREVAIASRISRRILDRKHSICLGTSPAPVAIKRPDPGTCVFCGQHLGNTVVGLQNLLSTLSVATRMSWAAERKTTRIEDEAYCMLGLFGVHMPLLYGEGRKAFVRLQEQIIMLHHDHSILATVDPRPAESWASEKLQLIQSSPALLATEARAFKHSGNLTRIPPAQRTVCSLVSFSRTSRTLDLSLLMCECTVLMKETESERLIQMTAWLGILDCVSDHDLLSRPAILLEIVRETGDSAQPIFHRVHSHSLLILSAQQPLSRKEKITVLSSQSGAIRIVKVTFDSKRIANKGIRLLLDGRLGDQTRPRCFVRICPLLQPKTCRYKIRYGWPAIEGQGSELRVELRPDEDAASGGVLGVLVVENDEKDGFLVAWGCRSKPLDSLYASGVNGATPKDDMVCRVLPWNAFAGRPLRLGRADVEIKVDEKVLHGAESASTRGRKSSLPYYTTDTEANVRASVDMSRSAFLNQVVWNLQIEILEDPDSDSDSDSDPCSKWSLDLPIHEIRRLRSLSKQARYTAGDGRLAN